MVVVRNVQKPPDADQPTAPTCLTAVIRHNDGWLHEFVSPYHPHCYVGCSSDPCVIALQDKPS